MFNVRMNSTGRVLVFTKANVRGQFLLVFSYEFDCGIDAAFTIRLYLWFSMYTGMFLVLLEHSMINRQKLVTSHLDL